MRASVLGDDVVRPVRLLFSSISLEHQLVYIENARFWITQILCQGQSAYRAELSLSPRSGRVTFCPLTSMTV